MNKKQRAIKNNHLKFEQKNIKHNLHMLIKI